MAAGLGFKTFATGDVLTAADTNGYLMQGVWVFADAAARDAAVTSPQEGNFAYLKDTNTTTYYTGSAWTNLDTTGMVNPMTTTGDVIYSSSGSTPERLGIGSTGQVLTVAGGVPTWATSASGGMTLISTTTASNSASISLTSIPGTYRELVLVITLLRPATNNTELRLRINSDATTNYYNLPSNSASGLMDFTSGSDSAEILVNISNGVSKGLNVIEFKEYANSSTYKFLENRSAAVGVGAQATERRSNAWWGSTSAITTLTLFMSSGNITSGTFELYGVK